MNWFWIALIGPFLWSVGTHLDKYLLSKYFKNTGVGALMVFTALTGVVLLPVILLFQSSVFNLSIFQALMIMLAGVFVTAGLLIYLYALQQDEASIVAPLFQTIPVFVYVLAFLLIGETLSHGQIIGSLLIIIGGVAISWNIEASKLKSKILFLMLLASLLIATESVIFKIFALETNFWTTAFWEYAGTAIFGLGLLLIKSYREKFFALWKQSKLTLIGLNFVNEIITMIGILTSRFAMLLVPIALVYSVNGFQPLIILLIGLGLTRFFPHLGKESIDRHHIVQKIIAIALMIIGAVLIERNT